MRNSKENEIRNVLKGQGSELDKTALWAGIEDRLPQRRKRKAGIWIFLGLLLLLASSTGLWYGLQDTYNQEVVHGEMEEIYAVIDDSIMDAVDNESESGSEEISNPEKGDVDMVNDEIRMSGRNNEKISTTYSSEAPNILRSGGGALTENLESSRLSSMKKVEEANIGLNKKLNELDLLPINGVLTGNNEFSSSILNRSIIPVEYCKAPRYSLIGMVGTNYGIPSVEGRGYNDKERGLLGTSASLLLDVRLGRRWSLRGGIGYAHSIIRYIDQQVEIVEGKTEGIAEISINEQGVSVPKNGEVTLTTVRMNDITWHRRHHSVDLMLLLNKDFQLSYRWRLALQGGLSYNANTLSSGYKYDFNEHVKLEKINKDVEGFFQCSWGLRPMAGLEIGYSIRNLEFIVNAHFVHTMNPINTLNQNYQIKHSQAGIQLGTRYILQGNKN